MKTIVYHNDETLARRSYHSKPSETVAYRSIADWDEKVNEDFDQVVNNATKKKKKVKEDG